MSEWKGATHHIEDSTEMDAESFTVNVNTIIQYRYFGVIVALVA